MNYFVAEFLGTFLLILMGSGVVANVVLPKTKGAQSGWIVITTAWAFGVFIAVVVAGPHSGAHINPAVSLALAITGDFAWDLLWIYIPAQILGAAFGSFCAWLIYQRHFEATDDKGLLFAPFATAPAIRDIKTNFISEFIGTFVLIIVILFSTPPQLMDTNATPIGLGDLGALPVAILVWVIGLALGGTTGYAINPARDLGPRIMHQILPIKGKGSSDWAYSWIPIIGPLSGAAFAAFIFIILK